MGSNLCIKESNLVMNQNTAIVNYPAIIVPLVFNQFIGTYFSIWLLSQWKFKDNGTLKYIDDLLEEL